MAILSMIIGGFFGMISAFAALVAFNASVLMALFVWSAVGTGMGLLILAIILFPRQKTEPQLVAEFA